MKIIIGKKAGFCYGVRKAVNMAELFSGRSNVFTIGPLIHNKHEVKRLAGKGIKPVSSIGSRGKGVFIIRTHGLPRAEMLKLKKKGSKVVDATCPFVRRSQNLIEKLSQKKYSIIIVGEKNHPEITGLVSYSDNPLEVVESAAEVKKLSLQYPIAVISQTTQSKEKFEKIVRAIKHRYKGAEIFNTICRATSERQEEAENIARKADLMLVIGGRNSGNTARLKSICSKYTQTRHVESPDEIRRSWFKGKNTIGITAGASTPGWLIDKVLNHINHIRRQSWKNLM